MPRQNASKNPFFSGLKPAETKRLLAIASPRRYAQGQTIFSKHEPGDNFYIVGSGLVRIFVHSGGRQKTLDYIREGDFFGEMALLDGKHRSASAEALEDTEVLVVPNRAFSKLLEDTAFSMRLLGILSRRLREADREIESLLFQNMLGRLARAIIRLAGPRKDEARTTLRELANYLGTTREPLSRAMAALKRCGLIDYCDRTLKIKDRRRLETTAQN